jgi:hypothetical protein
MATKHPLDGSAPPVNIGGRPPALQPEHIAVLHDIVTERAQASLQKIADELYDRYRARRPPLSHAKEVLRDTREVLVSYRDLLRDIMASYIMYRA